MAHQDRDVAGLWYDVSSADLELKWGSQAWTVRGIRKTVARARPLLEACKLKKCWETNEKIYQTICKREWSKHSVLASMWQIDGEFKEWTYFISTI